MFSGIIERTAELVETRTTPAGLRLILDAGPSAEGVRPGDSVACDGVCLTVAQVGGVGHDAPSVLQFDVIRETLRKTTLGRLRPGDVVNIERSMQAGGRIDGHMVQGHVDGTGTVVHKRTDAGEWLIWIEPPADLMPLIAPRGSVALAGVSLTVARVEQERFAVALIPTTLERTHLGQLDVGSVVNIETDMIARHVVHYLQRVGLGTSATNWA